MNRPPHQISSRQLRPETFTSIMLGVWLCTGPIVARAVERHSLAGHIPAAALGLAPAGVLPATNELKLAIGLPLRNRDELTNLLTQLYDPQHPKYRQFLTPPQFTEHFSPTRAQYQRVIEFAHKYGLAITGTHSNRLLLDVRGTVENIQRAFQTTLRMYPHPLETRFFYAPEAEPSVEEGVPVLDVTGLNNFIRPHPKGLRKGPAGSGSTHLPKGGSGPSGTYLGADFRAAYVPGVLLNGAGQVLGLLEFDGYYPNDIASYESQAGLPAVPLQTILLDGFDGIPTTGSSSGNNEVALDIEVAASMAPGLANILVYEAGPDGYANDILSRMANDNLAAQLSCSWDFGSDGNETTEQIFLQIAAQGQSFFNASGDSGAYTSVVPSPDDDPYITMVGGTTLSTTGPAGSWVSETTWNAGGGIASSGGYSTTYALPTWQAGIDMNANRGSTVTRNLPDVSMVADNISVVADNGQQYPIYGTSASAPLWAGFTALVNQYAAQAGYPRVGFLNPAVYALAKGPGYASYFHDVTSGNNTNNTTGNRFMAVPGYDLCTGWGSPVGSKLLAALALPDSLGITPVAGFVANGPIGGPFTVSSTTFSLTNSSGGLLDWQVSNNSTWLSVSPTNGTLGSGQIATVQVALNASASGLTPGRYGASLIFTNLSSQLTQTRQFTLAVGISLVLNGGFESGDFSYWTLAGPSAASFNSVDNGSAVLPHSGNYVATFGELGSLATITQPLSTRPGQEYLLSYWFTVTPDSSNLTTPNEFRVRFNNITLFDAVNLGVLDWTNSQFVVLATTASSLLEFGGSEDPFFIGLDDVTLTPIPTPHLGSIVAANGLLHFNWRSLPGLSYQVQYQTDPTQSSWQNLGAKIVATTAITSASDSISSAPFRFYRVVLLP